MKGTSVTNETAPSGIHIDRVTEWMSARIPQLAAPLQFSLITGGLSNLTYSVADRDGRRWVLRRPPLGQVLATAHDMGREFRIMNALQSSAVPVPSLVGFESDPSVNDAPFYVMDFVDGTVVRDAEVAQRLGTAERRRASESLVDVLAAIHEVDVEAVGLGDLGRHDGYLERQLKRWYQQYQGSKEQNPAVDLPIVDQVHDLLAARIPPQQGTSIVHGDYRLDNCMIGADGSVVAVLDWEICTLGDPLADLGLLCVYWTDPGSTPALPQASPTALDGFMTTAEVCRRYAEVSGRDLSHIDTYIAFGYWKLTCIMAGVWSRYAAGALGETDQHQADGFANMVTSLAALTAEAAEKV